MLCPVVQEGKILAENRQIWNLLHRQEQRSYT